MGFLRLFKDNEYESFKKNMGSSIGRIARESGVPNSVSDIHKIEARMSTLLGIRKQLSSSKHQEKLQQESLRQNMVMAADSLYAKEWHNFFSAFEKELAGTKNDRADLSQLASMMARTANVANHFHSSRAASHSAFSKVIGSHNFKSEFEKHSGTNFHDRHRRLEDAISGAAKHIHQKLSEIEEDIAVRESKKLVARAKSEVAFTKNHLLKFWADHAPLNFFIHISLQKKVNLGLKKTKTLLAACLERCKHEEKLRMVMGDSLATASKQVDESLGKLARARKTILRKQNIYARGFVSFSITVENAKHILKRGFIDGDDVSLSFSLEARYGEALFVFQVQDVIKDSVYFERAVQSTELHVMKKNRAIPVKTAIVMIPKEPAPATPDHGQLLLLQEQLESIRAILSNSKNFKVSVFPSKSELDNGWFSFYGTKVRVNHALMASSEEMAELEHGWKAKEFVIMSRLKALEESYASLVNEHPLIGQPGKKSYSEIGQILISGSCEPDFWLDGSNVQGWIKSHLVPYDFELFSKMKEKDFDARQAFAKRVFEINGIRLIEGERSFHPVVEKGDLRKADLSGKSFYLFRYE